jgi:hypothetical protein
MVGHGISTVVIACIGQKLTVGVMKLMSRCGAMRLMIPAVDVGSGLFPSIFMLQMRSLLNGRRRGSDF